MARTIVDPRLNLVFVHMCVPHPPSIYNARTDEFSDDPRATYFDNLRLTDRTIAEIHGTLAKAGMWDTTTVLLTADHPLRVGPDLWPREPHSKMGVQQHAEVPYLLKLAGQSQGAVYDRQVQEVVTKDLLLSILDKTVTTPEQVAAWLDARSRAQ